MINDIENILDQNEKIIWRGNPKFSAYILKSLPISLFGIFWCTFLVPFYWAVFTGKAPIFVWFVLGPHTFVGLGMLTAPIWQSLLYPYIEYAVTSKRIVYKSGFFARNFSTVDYVHLSDVSVNIGFIGTLTNTGDINFVSGMGMFVPKTGRGSLSGIENPYDVFKLLKQTYFDIKTDVEFPNKYRPITNPGYQTDYSQPYK